MRQKRLQIFSNGLTIQGMLQTPEVDSWPLVVLCHGLLSHKDSSKYKQLAGVFAGEGFASLRFDFRGCGESGGLLQNSTVSERWSDLQSVIEQVETFERFNGRFGILGSSLGGYLALLEASRNPRVRCVVVWSTPSQLDELGERLAEAAPASMSRAFQKDLSQLELLSRLRTVGRVLVIHGQEDQEVPPEHASELFDAVKEPKALHVLADGDHRFTAMEVREQAVRLSLDWFRRFL